ncbi:GNAT family N-acetyltransferase [Enterococcus sp. OL5]|uniref:GNAT family N-acetyltransferase n=1 Tax=Enterococcus sp. OL5 TaxID=2590214 RepID=UPI001127DC45|nr:GNAT family N-acetyltransferase [Enterococcus sp. OL5]TPR55119.1 GNAT family N-acetyltransferase [Enterococcus sp. OL5]
MSLRLLTTEDAAFYHEVLYQGYQRTKQFAVSFEAAEYRPEDSEAWLLAHPTYGWFEESLTSVLSLRMPWSGQPGPYGVPHIGHFTTHPDFSGQGYGTKLFQAVEWEILQKQLRTPFVTLGTAVSHPWLNAMYQRFGFYEIEKKQLIGKQHLTIFYRKDF